MEMPNRKRNRLSQYDYGQEGSYFITLCTEKRACLFFMEHTGDSEKGIVPKIQNQIIHKWIKESMNKYPNISVDRYTIMPDHLHLLITIKESQESASLPDMMRFFKTMTTNEYIRGVKSGILSPFSRKAMAEILS